MHSFPTTIFLRRALNNQSLVDAAFRHRKPESHTGVSDPAVSSSFGVAPHDGAPFSSEHLAAHVGAELVPG